MASVVPPGTNGVPSAGAATARLCALAVFLSSFAVYSQTALPGVSFADWAEMQTVPSLLGVTHPTGYPLYTLLGWAFSHLPLGAIAFRMNLFSAFCVSSALATLTLAACGQGVRPLVSTTIALCVGAAPAVWYTATRAEVHTLHFLLFSLLLHRALLWATRRRSADFYLLAFLLGLSFTHHLLSVFFNPCIGLFALWTGRRELRARPEILILAGALFVLPLALYLYIPIRAAQHAPRAYATPYTPSELYALVSGTETRSDMHFLDSSSLARTLAGILPRAGLLAENLTPIVAVFTLSGAVVVAWRDRGLFLLFAAVVLANLHVAAGWSTADPPRYLLTTFAVCGLFGAFGAEAVARRLPRPLRRAAWLVAALPLLMAAGNWNAVSQAENHSAEEFLDQLFSRLPPNAALLTYWDSATPIWYAQFIEQRRTDVMVVDKSTIHRDGWEDMISAAARLVGKRPTYTLFMNDYWSNELSRYYGIAVVDRIPASSGAGLRPDTTAILIELLPRTPWVR